MIETSIRKLYVVCFVILIITTGMLWSYIGALYTVPLAYLLGVFNINQELILDRLSFLARDGSLDQGIGIFLYYPTYLFLHFGLIHNLFYHNKRLKKKLILTLGSVVVGLAFLILLFKALDLMYWFNISRKYFNLLVARPLILFLIEGGGMIYEKVEQSELWGN